MQILETKPTLSDDEFEVLRRNVQSTQNDEFEVVAKPTATLNAIGKITTRLRQLHEILREKEVAKHKVYGSIIAVIPTYEAEENVGATIESLLLQSRQIEKIVVLVNGPGRTNVAFSKAQPYAEHFTNVEVVRCDFAGKVNALNRAYRDYVIPGGYDYLLGADADVTCDSKMVECLEKDIINYQDALGVKARYSFTTPHEMSRKSKGVVYGQRLEFAMTEMKQQLRGGRTEILGGQSTLFRVSALQDVARTSIGGMPWNPHSKVEDAELTRVAARRGYTARASMTARAWTGLMNYSYEWHKQRRKWQDGHLEDMVRDFHPVQDARRWMQQFVLGWNVLIRVMFASLMIPGILLDRYVFSPIWLIPIALSMVQSLLVAIKIPNRSLGEITRAVVFVPGEIYYLRTLSVWIESVVSTALNARHDGWKRQYAAEASQRKTAVSGWMVLILALTLPALLVMSFARFTSSAHVSVFFSTGWNILTAMTICSIAAMVILIFRILRQFRTLAP